MRSLDCSPGFDPSRRLGQLRCLGLTDRQPAEPREDILFKPNQSARSVPRTRLAGMDGCVPFARDGFEAVDDDL